MVPIQALPPGLKRCLQLAQANPANRLPPLRTTGGHKLWLSHPNQPRSAPSRLASQMAQRAPTHTSLPSSPRPTRWETCPSCQRRIGRPKAGYRHSGPPRHGPRLCWLLYSSLPSMQTKQLPGCGVNPQTVEHVIQVCPRYERARAAHLPPIAPDLSLSLFGTKKGGKALLTFLEVTEACRLQAVRG